MKIDRKTILKICLILVCSFFIGVIIGSIHNYYTKPSEDFIIWQSFKTSFSNGETCHIKVIVNKKDYNPDEMAEEIRNEYNRINGEVDELTMQLFNSKSDFEDYIIAHEYTFIADDADDVFRK